MKINSNNEWGTLKEVILGSMNSYFPGLEFEKSFNPKNYDKSLKLAKLAYPNWYVDEVKEDLNDLKKLFLKNNVKVLRPKKYNVDRIFHTPNFSAVGCDSYNVRDLHMVVGNKIISSASPAKYRFFEPYCLNEIFYNYMKKDFQWISSPKPSFQKNYLIPFTKKQLHHIKEDQIQKKIMKGRVEKFYSLREDEIIFDAAAVIRMNNDLVYLVSNTGNYLAAKWLQNILGKKYKVHIATSYRASHIDSTILPLSSSKVLINSVRVPKKRVPKVFNKWKKIFFSDVVNLPDSEIKFQKNVRDKYYKKLKDLGVNSYLNSISSPWAGLNVLSVNKNTVMVDKRQIPLIRTLEKNKFNVIPVRLRHCYTMLGGLHCSTLDTVRGNK
tara:strand:- start:105 stop:1250 length:1146 start_codon:yes stop_codon:yes gene_type:complete